MSTFDTHDYADGTSLTQSYPFGSYVAALAMCADGRVRAVKRIAATADTFFSVPCAVAVAGRTVSGYLTIETRSGASTASDSDPAVVKFAAYDYGRNADALPAGLWRSTTPATRALAVRISYYDDGDIMFNDFYGEDEAGSANVFGADDTCVVALTRSPRGRWMIDTSDYGHTLSASAYRRRFATVVDAVDYLAARTGIALRVVDDWDDADAAELG